VLIATVSCHGLRPPNHLYVILLYDNRTGVDQCLWLSLVVCRIGYLSTRFLGESLVYILRENRGRTEELTGYWVIRSGLVCLLASILTTPSHRPFPPSPYQRRRCRVYSQGRKKNARKPGSASLRAFNGAPYPTALLTFLTMTPRCLPPSGVPRCLL